MGYYYLHIPYLLSRELLPAKEKLTRSDVKTAWRRSFLHQHPDTAGRFSFVVKEPYPVRESLTQRRLKNCSQCRCTCPLHKVSTQFCRHVFCHRGLSAFLQSMICHLAVVMAHKALHVCWSSSSVGSQHVCFARTDLFVLKPDGRVCVPGEMWSVLSDL